MSKWKNIAGLIWLDLETTGLDPEQDHILEVYAELLLVGSQSVPIVLADCAVACAPADFDSRADDYVRQMHTSSGLLAAVNAAYDSRRNDLCDVERAILAQLPELPYGHKFLLAGNSVHFDLGFLRACMPKFAATLSHRVLDITTLQLFAELIRGENVAPKGEAAHRARQDVEYSRAELTRIAELFA